MTHFSSAIFQGVDSLTIGSAIIQSSSDSGQAILTVNPYTNYGQHASEGGRIDNYNEERRAASAQDIVSPRMVPESIPTHERVNSAPAVVESQPSSREPLHETSTQLNEDGPSDAKATVMAKDDVFAELWTGALDKYKERTGVDIRDRRNGFVQRFDDCEDTSDALAVLEKLVVFKKHGARTSWMRIKDPLKKVLDVVIVLNTLAAEVANVAVPRFGKLIFVGTGLLLKAAKDITKQAETLEKLFSRLAAFLSRLEVRGRAKIQPSSKKIIIKILVELLNALAIATVIAKGKFWNKLVRATKKLLFDQDEIEKVLSKLSELTEEESAMILAELASSRDDFKELVREVGGLDISVKALARQMRSVIGTGNLDNKEFAQLSSLLQSTKTEDKAEILRVLQLLKLENDGTQVVLSRIEADMQELRKSLARDSNQSTANGQTVHVASEIKDHTVPGVMQDTYDEYVNFGQHVAGGKVEIRKPQTTAPPVNSPSRRPERLTPVPTGTSRDRYGSYANYGQHVTNGEVIIDGATTFVQR